MIILQGVEIIALFAVMCFGVAQHQNGVADAMIEAKNTIKDIQESDLNGGLTIWGILPTLYTITKAHHKEVLAALCFKYGAEVYEEPSRDTTKYNDATVLKTDVSVLDKALGAYWDRLAATLVERRKVT